MKKFIFLLLLGASTLFGATAYPNPPPDGKQEQLKQMGIEINPNFEYAEVVCLNSGTFDCIIALLDYDVIRYDDYVDWIRKMSYMGLKPLSKAERKYLRKNYSNPYKRIYCIDQHQKT